MLCFGAQLHCARYGQSLTEKRIFFNCFIVSLYGRLSYPYKAQYSYNCTTGTMTQLVDDSLSRPSLRRRLETYYQRVSPDQVASLDEWNSRFEVIWRKYGGSYQGEYCLQSKLAKKYGTQVLLQIPSEKSKKIFPNESMQEAVVSLEVGTGSVDFCSANFDPVATLRQRNAAIITTTNPWIEDDASLLDRVDLFRHLLPKSDLLYQPTTRAAQRLPLQDKQQPPRKRKTTYFASIADELKDGPMETLYKAFHGKKQIKVVVRDSHKVRGHIVGFLVAFDRHMNLILRSAKESCFQEPTKDDTPEPVIRHFETVLVRGDTIVLVHLVER